MNVMENKFFVKLSIYLHARRLLNECEELPGWMKQAFLYIFRERRGVEMTGDTDKTLTNEPLCLTARHG